MTAKTHALPRRGEPDREAHVEWLANRSDERWLLFWASTLAVMVHGLAFMIDLPEPTVPVPPPRPFVPTVSTTVLPPPPPLESPAVTYVDTTRRRPIPARDMDSLEPVEEPAPEVVEDPVVDDLGEIPLAPSVPPPALEDLARPRRFTPDMQRPVLIEDSKVSPEYPAMARQAGIAGEVIVEAVILRDGRVGEVTVVSATPPGLGFEASALEAVRQWRYEPARQFGEPVEVYFTVYVRFELR